MGLAKPDDAGVYRLDAHTALVQTVDFFTPVVDNPYDFGRVAATNALSDVYAMGARPLTALTLLGFPQDTMPDAIVREILRGGQDVMHEAGAAILGGHTVDDPEPKFGYAVTGLVDPEQLLTKGAVRPGDLLILTKPIGIGVLTTAIKKANAVEPDIIRRLVDVMTQRNALGMVLPELGVRAATDVTGFGLLGHAWEMASESGVDMQIELSDVPILPEALPFARQGFFPGGTRRNALFLADKVSFADTVPEVYRLLLADAVTSGGLLIAASEEVVPRVLEAAARHGAAGARVIGRATKAGAGRIRVEGRP